MKFLLIVTLTVVALALDRVACDSSSSEEVSNDDLVQNEFTYYPPPIQHHIGQPAYPPHYPPVYPPHYQPHNNNCQTCTLIVNYIHQYGGNSQYSRNNALHSACSHVGSANMYACQQFVQTYGSQLTHYLRPHDSTYTICHYIRAC